MLTRITLSLPYNIAVNSLLVLRSSKNLASSFDRCLLFLVLKTKAGLGNHFAIFVPVYPPPIIAMQRLGKHVPAAINTHATIEEQLDAVFSAILVVSNTQYVVK
jgi:hypothetical protein